ncbi:MAG: hypothetical protein ACJ0BR_06325 [Candidatus Puniceispirillales bacterium]
MSENIRNNREKFKTLANKRVNKALQTLKLIGNLSNKRHYDYDDTDAKKILKALDDELKSVKQKFSKSTNTSGEFNID